jgi:hypothetical protein
MMDLALFEMQVGELLEAYHDPEVWLRDSLATAARIFNKTERVNPTGLLMTTINPGTGEKGGIYQVVTAHERGEFDGPAKTRFSSMLQAAGAQFGAKAILFFSEAWWTESTSKEEMQKILSFARNHSLKELPETQRREVVMATFQLCGQAATRLFVAYITVEDGKRRLGQFTERLSDGHAGRFAGMMPVMN